MKSARTELKVLKIYVTDAAAPGLEQRLSFKLCSSPKASTQIDDVTDDGGFREPRPERL